MTEWQDELRTHLRESMADPEFAAAYEAERERYETLDASEES